jgi:hypothetical protein
MTPDERRQEPRVRAAYNIAFECFLSGIKVDEGIAHTVNMSEHGALIEMPHGADLDASLIIWITAPFYTLLVKGNVVHSRSMGNGLFHVGVKLTDVIEGNWTVLRRDMQTRMNEGLIEA